MSKAKARFHQVMAEHYAQGGEVKDDEIRFGNQESYLSGDQNEASHLEDIPQGPDFDGVESQKEAPDMKKRQRLHAIRMGK